MLVIVCICLLALSLTDAFIGTLSAGVMRLPNAFRSTVYKNPLRQVDQNLAKTVRTKHLGIYSREVDDEGFESLDFDDDDDPRTKGGGERNE